MSGFIATIFGGRASLDEVKAEAGRSEYEDVKNSFLDDSTVKLSPEDLQAFLGGKLKENECLIRELETWRSEVEDLTEMMEAYRLSSMRQEKQMQDRETLFLSIQNDLQESLRLKGDEVQVLRRTINSFKTENDQQDQKFKSFFSLDWNANSSSTRDGMPNAVAPNRRRSTPSTTVSSAAKPINPPGPVKGGQEMSLVSQSDVQGKLLPHTTCPQWPIGTAFNGASVQTGNDVPRRLADASNDSSITQLELQHQTEPSGTEGSSSAPKTFTSSTFPSLSYPSESEGEKSDENRVDKVPHTQALKRLRQEADFWRSLALESKRNGAPNESNVNGSSYNSSRGEKPLCWMRRPRDYRVHRAKYKSNMGGAFRRRMKVMSGQNVKRQMKLAAIELSAITESKAFSEVCCQTEENGIDTNFLYFGLAQTTPEFKANAQDNARFFNTETESPRTIHWEKEPTEDEEFTSSTLLLHTTVPDLEWVRKNAEKAIDARSEDGLIRGANDDKFSTTSSDTSRTSDVLATLRRRLAENAEVEKRLTERSSIVVPPNVLLSPAVAQFDADPSGEVSQIAIGTDPCLMCGCSPLKAKIQDSKWCLKCQKLRPKLLAMTIAFQRLSVVHREALNKAKSGSGDGLVVPREEHEVLKEILEERTRILERRQFEISRLEIEVEEVREMNEALANEIAECREKAAAEAVDVARMKDKEKSSNECLSRVQRECEDLRSDIEVLANEKGARKAEIETYKQNMSSLELASIEMQSREEKLIDEINELRASIQDALRDAETSKRKNDEQSLLVEVNVKAQENMMAKLTILQCEWVDAERRNRDLQGKIDSYSNDNEELAKKYEGLQVEMGSYRNVAQEIREENRRLQEEVESFRDGGGEIEELRSEKSRLEQEMLYSRTEVQKFEAEIVRSRNVIQSMRVEIESIRSMNESLHNENFRLRNMEADVRQRKRQEFERLTGNIDQIRLSFVKAKESLGVGEDVPCGKSDLEMHSYQPDRRHSEKQTAAKELDIDAIPDDLFESPRPSSLCAEVQPEITEISLPSTPRGDKISETKRGNMESSISPDNGPLKSGGGGFFAANSSCSEAFDAYGGSIPQNSFSSVAPSIVPAGISMSGGGWPHSSGVNEIGKEAKTRRKRPVVYSAASIAPNEERSFVNRTVSIGSSALPRSETSGKGKSDGSRFAAAVGSTSSGGSHRTSNITMKTESNRDYIGAEVTSAKAGGMLRNFIGNFLGGNSQADDGVGNTSSANMEKLTVANTSQRQPKEKNANVELSLSEEKEELDVVGGCWLDDELDEWSI